MRGRKPKPTELRMLEGTARGLKDFEPAPLPEKPRMPRGYSAEEKAEWKAIVKVMDEMGLLSASYQRALECYVDAYCKYRRASADLDQRSIADRLYPLSSRQYHAHHDEVRKWLAEFGLTPTAKARVHTVRQTKTKSVVKRDRLA